MVAAGHGTTIHPPMHRAGLNVRAAAPAGMPSVAVVTLSSLLGTDGSAVVGLVSLTLTMAEDDPRPVQIDCIAPPPCHWRGRSGGSCPWVRCHSNVSSSTD